MTESDAWAGRPRFALDADVTVYWPDVRPDWVPEDDDEDEADVTTQEHGPLV